MFSVVAYYVVLFLCLVNKTAAAAASSATVASTSGQKVCLFAYFYVKINLPACQCGCLVWTTLCYVCSSHC